MSRPRWAAGLLTLTLALPVQAAPAPAMPRPPEVAPAALAPAVTEATALQVARSLFPALLLQGAPTVELLPAGSSSTWQISWTGSESVQVSIDSRDGQVIAANRWPNGPSMPQRNRMTRVEAERQAVAWLARLAPGARAALVPATQNYPEWPDPFAFSFNYEWRAMGYPVPNAGAHLRIDSETGELLGWFLNRPEGRLVHPPVILAEAEAKAAFAKLPLTLSYMETYWAADQAMLLPPMPAERRMRLVYQPPAGAMLAQSGAWIGSDGEPLPEVGLPAWKQVPPPIIIHKPPAEPLSRAEALQIAQGLTGQKREPESVNVGRWSGGLTYSFGWLDWANPEGGSEAQVTIDATRGLVQEVWGTPPGGNPSLTPAEALQVAISFIQTYRPDLAGLLYHPTAVQREGGSPYAFQFERQHEGILVQGYGVNVTIDAVTGRVVSFWSTTQEPEWILPEPTGLLAPGPLMAKLVDVAGLELSWVQSWPIGGEPYYQLVWQLGRAVPVSQIEAQTGIFRDYDGTDVLKYRLPPTDVAGHWAQREIEALFAQRIVTVEAGRFQPEQVMTEAEAATWLARLDYQGPRPLEVEAALQPIAPGEPNPATPITREAFVRQVVVALGYERIAGMANQIWLPFHDQAQIEPGARNAVAVLNGLGVIQGTPEGNFLPKKSLTRAEAARILFQSLEHRRVGYYK